jgi:hypothetical protein
MKIRIPVGVILVAVVLVLVIGFSSCSNCQKYVPYSSNVWSNTSSKFHEGFSTYPNHASVDTLDAQHVANTVTSQGSGLITPSGVRLWGFGSNLYSGSDNDKPVDMFGPTPGSIQCFNRSFGLSKSTGPLCTTDDQYRLMTTRGGNAAGVNAQIGGR